MHPISPRTKLYCVIGQPLSHSLSPLMHNRAFEVTGQDAIYMAFPQTEESLPGFFAGFRSLPIMGCNITLPFKVPAMKYVDGVSERARRVGSINTVYWRDGKLLGENTDVDGFAVPLRGRKFEHALILGAGGVSRAAIVALQELGVPKISLTNRTFAKAQVMAEEFGIECVPWEQRAETGCDLVVNATSLGMKGAMENMSPCPEGFFHGRAGLAYDIIYTPEKTVFLKQAEEAGWEVQTGVTMFVEQGRASFRLWTGIPMPAEEACDAVRGALAARG
ncbi:MAG: shikimate dehydrogenase [Desulfovibrionaceae bacterium]|nr:shikimate dehydrogenase [Desulfovibrionaceae bacterium]